MIDIALLIAIVLSLTELFKRLDTPKKYLPLISLVAGVAAGVFYLDGALEEQILFGVMIGLTASGLFDQSKIITRSGR